MATANDLSKIDSDAKESLPVRANFTSTIFLNSSFDACGIKTISDKTNIIYKQTVVVTYGSNPNPNVIREEKDMYTIMCLRNRTAQIMADFNSTINYRTDGSESKSRFLSNQQRYISFPYFEVKNLKSSICENGNTFQF